MATSVIHAAAMKLKDPLLLRELCFIDGAWAAADNGGTLAVHNPATAEKLGLIPNMGTAECRRAIACGCRGPAGLGGPHRQGSRRGTAALVRSACSCIRRTSPCS